MACDCYSDCIAFLDEQLDHLLSQLQGQGLLGNTTVIITSDHGEGFGDHGFFGHAYGVSLDEIGVPLVILSPRAPAGREVNTPVSLRDLPATVVELLGLESGSPFPGRSLAAHWRPAGSSLAAAEMTTPAFSEQADWALLEANPPPNVRLSDFQMSLVAGSQHYSRDGLGTERLFDLTEDPFEMDNLMGRTEGKHKVGVFRRMLLNFLTENPASVEVETAYLKRYREQLSSTINGPSPAVASSVAVGN